MDQTSILRLMTWFSPSYPVGAYTYSHGLETGVANGDIKDVDTAYDWLETIITSGAGKSDVIFLNEAYNAILNNDHDALAQAAEMSAAFCSSQEIELESTAQGRAFISVTEQSWPCDALGVLKTCWEGPYVYPVVVGVVAAGHNVSLRETGAAYLHAFSANLISALVRLIPLGQTDGQRLTARLEAVVIKTAREALELSLEDVSNTCLMVDIASMQHETLHTRLFRS